MANTTTTRRRSTEEILAAVDRGDHSVEELEAVIRRRAVENLALLARVYVALDELQAVLEERRRHDDEDAYWAEVADVLGERLTGGRSGAVDAWCRYFSASGEGALHDAFGAVGWTARKGCGSMLEARWAELSRHQVTIRAALAGGWVEGVLLDDEIAVAEVRAEAEHLDEIAGVNEIDLDELEREVRAQRVPLGEGPVDEGGAVSAHPSRRKTDRHGEVVPPARRGWDDWPDEAPAAATVPVR